MTMLFPVICLKDVLTITSFRTFTVNCKMSSLQQAQPYRPHQVWQISFQVQYAIITAHKICLLPLIIYLKVILFNQISNMFSVVCYKILCLTFLLAPVSYIVVMEEPRVSVLAWIEYALSSYYLACDKTGQPPMLKATELDIDTLSTCWPRNEPFCSELVHVHWSKVCFLVFLSLNSAWLIPAQICFTAHQLPQSYIIFYESAIIQQCYSTLICIWLINLIKLLL